MDNKININIPTKPILSPSPSPEEFNFPEHMEFMNELEQSSLQVLIPNDLYDDIVQVEEYLINVERKEFDELSAYVLGEQLEEENIKLKSCIRCLLKTIQIVSDANNLLFVIVFILLVITMTGRCRVRSKHANAASNTTYIEEETVKV